MAKKKEKKSKNDKVKNLVFNIVLWTLGGVAVLIIILWDYIFKGKPIYDAGTSNGFVAFGKWWVGNVDKVVYTVVVIAVVLLIIALFSLIAKFIKLRNKKAATFVSLIKSLLKWAIILVGVFLILKKWGVDTKAILASIGIIALIIGLGCQSLISDVVAGIFLVADNAFEVGDIVVVDDFRGTVIEIGLKNTKLEDAGGNVKVISNSSINSLVNLTNSLSLAIVEISIPYEENLARTETLLIERLKDMPKRIPSIVEGPYYKGVEDMGDSAVILKVIAKVKEEDRFQATRDMKRDIYIFLNENSITVPYPQLTITQGPNPADHPEWVDKEQEEAKAMKEAQKQQEDSKYTEGINELQ
jgi:small conductance mechanosensitive channel